MKEPANSIGIENRKQTLSFSQIRRWPEFGVILAFLILLAIFSIFSSKFLTLRNITGILTIVSELGIMAIGVAFLMIAGEFDLSVSSVYAFSGFLFVTLANKYNSPLAFVITLAIEPLSDFVMG